MTFTYAQLSLYPINQRERILADWLVQYAWEVLNRPTEREDRDNE